MDCPSPAGGATLSRGLGTVHPVRLDAQSGSGYGDPLTRELEDVVEGYVTGGRAEAVYGVVLIGSPADGTLEVDQTTTEACRAALAARSAVPPPNACRIGQG